MKIIIKTTSEWSALEWETFIHSFNSVFDKSMNREYFNQKYFQTIDNVSYHSLLTCRDEVVGACTVIPYNYFIRDTLHKIGLVVDVFIREDMRNDPLTLYRMYKNLRQLLIKKSISLIVAVPNDMSYSYWKNIVKWKDIGMIRYYALPINTSKLIPKIPKVYDFLFLFGFKVLSLIGSFYNFKAKDKPIRIDINQKVVDIQRYTEEHKQIYTDTVYFSYRITLEEGIKTCYLINFYALSSHKKTSKSIREAVKYLQKNEKPELILYVGTLNFFQTILFKVPRKFEPKSLLLTTDMYTSMPDAQFICNIDNWDFGLYNYDVR